MGPLSSHPPAASLQPRELLLACQVPSACNVSLSLLSSVSLRAISAYPDTRTPTPHKWSPFLAFLSLCQHLSPGCDICPHPHNGKAESTRHGMPWVLNTSVGSLQARLGLEQQLTCSCHSHTRVHTHSHTHPEELSLPRVLKRPATCSPLAHPPRTPTAWPTSPPRLAF